jgi:hypothetical protein
MPTGDIKDRVAASIYLPNGTRIEMSGTPEEVGRAAKAAGDPTYSLPVIPGILYQPIDSGFYYCVHEYPNLWHGTVPPACTKCGEAALMDLTTTVAEVQ